MVAFLALMFLVALQVSEWIHVWAAYGTVKIFHLLYWRYSENTHECKGVMHCHAYVQLFWSILTSDHSKKCLWEQSTTYRVYS